MFETPVTIVGNIVTDPVHRRVGEHTVVKFRVASNSRRRRDDGTWEHKDSLFVSVSCWNRLVAGVGPLAKGDPVIVVGQAYTSEYDKDGIRRSSLEVRATAVGPDLARSTVRLERLKRANEESPGAEPTEPADPAEPADETDEDADALDDGALSLTA